MADVVRVIVVEREPLYRHGLVAVLDSLEGIEVVGSADSVESGYKLGDETSPSVALVGTNLTESPGLSFAAEMRRRYPAIATIVIASHESDDELFAAIRDATWMRQPCSNWSRGQPPANTSSTSNS